jgi:DNA-binding CsgD family transcriptional regulator/predicted nucleic acid-binding protein
VAAALHNLGNLRAESDEPAEAVEIYDESLTVYRELGDRWGVAMTLAAAADAALAAGDHRRAWQSRLESLLEYRRLGLAPHLAEVALAIAGMALRSGQPQGAEALYRAAKALRGAPADEQRSLMDEVVTTATSLEFRRVVTVEDDSPGPTPAPGGLSDRETEVAGLVAGGLPNREIAERLFISERTVESHIAHIRTKLGVTSRTQLVRWALANGLGAPAPSPQA